VSAPFLLGSAAAAHGSAAVPTVLLALAFVIVAAKLGGELVERLGLPAVLGELTVGILKCIGLEIPLSSHGIKVLDELRTLTSGEGFVLPTRRKDGTTGHRSESWKAVTRLQEASGVLDYTNHAVRKTISTYIPAPSTCQATS
jgi:hypothetical protein